MGDSPRSALAEIILAIGQTLDRLKWWLLIVAVLILAYTIGGPKDMGVLEWVKSLLQSVSH